MSARSIESEMRGFLSGGSLSPFSNEERRQKAKAMLKDMNGSTGEPNDFNRELEVFSRSIQGYVAIPEGERLHSEELRQLLDARDTLIYHLGAYAKGVVRKYMRPELVKRRAAHRELMQV